MKGEYSRDSRKLLQSNRSKLSLKSSHRGFWFSGEITEAGRKMQWNNGYTQAPTNTGLNHLPFQTDSMSAFCWALHLRSQNKAPFFLQL